jgi:peptidoglycan/xylan/chitin deacetylase (PgdA/CDA1 family)
MIGAGIMSERARIFLSLDVEEFDLPLEFGISLSLAEQCEVTAEGLARVNGLVDELGIVATCFTTAAFAQARPELVAQLAQSHEIASHSFHHSRFEETDLADSRQVLIERSGGQSVQGFRRPRFAPTSVRAIAAAGYTYNSSLHPIWLPGRYNNFHCPRLPYQEEGLWQIPVSVSPLVRFPFFWLSFKNFPLPLIRWMSGWTLRQDRMLNLIFHPWEFADLTRYGLPKFIRRWDGDRLRDRLGVYLRWLQGRGDFMRFDQMMD